MAFLSSKVTVAATATVIYTFTNDITSVLLQTATGAATIYLGGPEVTAAGGGYSMAAGAELTVTGNTNEKLYGIVASSTEVVALLAQGV